MYFLHMLVPFQVLNGDFNHQKTTSIISQRWSWALKHPHLKQKCLFRE